MQLTKNELIKALVKELKLDDNIFTYQAVAEEVEFLCQSQLMDFFKAVMSAESFGNGMKAIIDIAKQFKPKEIAEVDRLEVEAKKLISLVHTMNATIFDNATKSGRTFIDELNGTKFKGIDSEIAILNQVKPYSDYKLLVGNISCYLTSLDQLNAFKKALTPKDKNENMIEHEGMKKLVRSVA